MASEPDFDWVTAQYNCSLPVQFSLLQQSAEKSVAARKQVFGGAPLDRLRFEEISDEAFSVTLASRHYPKTVVICLLEDHIDVVKVEDNNRSTMFKVTLELNGEGECVFQIDGAGEFLRWQVVRRALHLAFPRVP